MAGRALRSRVQPRRASSLSGRPGGSRLWRKRGLQLLVEPLPQTQVERHLQLLALVDGGAVGCDSVASPAADGISTTSLSTGISSCCGACGSTASVSVGTLGLGASPRRAGLMPADQLVELAEQVVLSPSCRPRGGARLRPWAGLGFSLAEIVSADLVAALAIEAKAVAGLRAVVLVQADDLDQALEAAERGRSASRTGSPAPARARSARRHGRG